MIHEIDDALRALIERDALRGSDVEVVFEAPTKDWATRRSTPTIDCYLYDIREDRNRRTSGQATVRDAKGAVVSRHLPPRHFRLAYLLTAWTQRPEDEHRLLAALLSCFLRTEIIPFELLTGATATLGMPVPVLVAQPPPENRQLSDVWSALGGELKPSLDVVVIAPMDPASEVPIGPPISEPPRFGIAGAGGQSETVHGEAPPNHDEDAEIEEVIR